MTKKWKKITAENFFIIFFWSKTAIYLSLGLHKVCPSYRRSLQFSKEAIQHFIKWTFTNYCLLLWVIFVLLDPDPDSESTDPIEYGSNPDPQPCFQFLPLNSLQLQLGVNSLHGGVSEKLTSKWEQIKSQLKPYSLVEGATEHLWMAPCMRKHEVLSTVIFIYIFNFCKTNVSPYIILRLKFLSWFLCYRSPHGYRRWLWNLKKINWLRFRSDIRDF